MKRRRRARGAAIGLLGVGVAAGAAALLYYLLSRPKCSCQPGSAPIVHEDGTCACSEVGIEVIPFTPSTPSFTPDFAPYPGAASSSGRCHTDGECGPGTVCINGECRPESEWYA